MQHTWSWRVSTSSPSSSPSLPAEPEPEPTQFARCWASWAAKLLRTAVRRRLWHWLGQALREEKVERHRIREEVYGKALHEALLARRR
eukprot:100805-Amphidinium_carterae.3